jgi:hypothetical protein
MGKIVLIWIQTQKSQEIKHDTLISGLVQYNQPNMGLCLLVLSPMGMSLAG